jgi:hypothetical protein
MSTATSEVARAPSPVLAELRRVATTSALRRSCVAVLLLGVLAPLANTASLTVRDSPHQTANAFTSLNAGVFLAMVLGVLGTTGAAHLPSKDGPAYRRAVGAKARAYGLVGIGTVLVLAAFAAAIALPLIQARGLATPSSPVVVEYVQREAVAAARLAVIGVAIGVVVAVRWRAVGTLITFLVVDGIAELQVPFVKNYGPIGALNAFSDPSHHHQLSVGAGAMLALGWALLALVLATFVSETRRDRAVAHETRGSL